MRHALWSLYVPSQTVGTDVVFFDLYNGADRDITVSSVTAIKVGGAAVSGLTSVHLLLTRTSATGTGGTAASSGGTGLGTCTVSNIQQSALPEGITARFTPTGGATAGAVICCRDLFTEETTPANYQPLEFLDCLLTVPEGTGIRVVQGVLASVGSIAFGCLFY